MLVENTLFGVEDKVHIRVDLWNGGEKRHFKKDD